MTFDPRARVPMYGDVLVSVLVSVGPGQDTLRMRTALENQILPDRVRMEIIMEPRGTIAESRNLMLARMRGQIAAFCDTDHIPCPDWLRLITAPIRAGYADFTAGPTYPWIPEMESETWSHIEAYENRRWIRYHERWQEAFYDICRHDPTRFAMGSTAWRTDLIRSLWFDERFTRNGVGGDDYDINVRAVMAGARGVWCENAWGYDDVSALCGLWPIFRKRVKYAVGFGLVMHKNRSAFPNVVRRHLTVQPFGKRALPSMALRLVVSPFAWVVSWVWWNGWLKNAPSISSRTVATAIREYGSGP